jgi:uncharacterized protein (TIGR04552 family)
LPRHRTSPLRVDRVLRLDDLSLEDLEAVRLLLRGGSVIDWHQLDFRDHADVDRFLRINEFDPESTEDNALLEGLRDEAIDYLVRTFSFHIPEDVAEQVPARDLFLIASRKGRRQVWACVVLKVMHIVHHLRGRELMLRLPISDDAVFSAIELKVMQVVEELRAAGYAVYEFQWSRKPGDSLVTKLLSKRSTLAANIYDKLRFRLVVKERADLVPMLAALTRRLIPFNYVVPGESINHLVSVREEMKKSATLRHFEPHLKVDLSLERKQEEKAAAARLNEFSGPEYRIINFVADIPVRLSAVLRDENADTQGHVVFVLTEFQLADKATTISNEQGQSNHDAYKARQHHRVRQRLMRGTQPADLGDPGGPAEPPAYPPPPPPAKDAK